MTVLVTGGTGYLGAAIVRALAARGHTPVVFARSAERAGLAGRAIAGDVRDRAALSAAARGVDAICHSAALVSVWRPNPREFDDVNVGGLEHAIAAARDHGIERLVYTSSFLARPPAGHTTPLHANDYQRTKAAANQVARRAIAEGAPITVMYPGVIFGPGLQSEANMLGGLLADHLAGRLPGVIGPERIWSFAWVESVAAAHVAALEAGRPGAEYLLGGENLPQIRPFELLRDWRGARLPRRIPPWVATLIGAAEEARARVTGRRPLLTRRTVEIFRVDWPLDSSRAEAELGYAPVPLADGLTKMLDALAVRPSALGPRAPGAKAGAPPGPRAQGPEP